MDKQKTNRSAILGFILIFAGLLVIAGQLNIVPWNIREVIFSWQMILIGIGLVLVLTREGSSAGWILLAIGGFFLVPEIFDVPFTWRRLFWPAIFIIVGLLLIFRIGNIGRPRFEVDGEINDEDYFDDVAIFGGGSRLITTQNLKGGKITAIFGGSQLNFTQTKLANGKIYIDYFTLFGGTNLIIPDDWEVKVSITPILGGFSDKRNPRPDVAKDPSKQVIIKGIAIFGGGELKSF